MPGKGIIVTTRTATDDKQQSPCPYRQHSSVNESVKRIRGNEIAMGTNSPSFQPSSSSQEENSTVYGMLVVLGYNGEVQNGDVSSFKKSYVVRKRDTPSGVRPFRQHSAMSHTGKQIVNSEYSHSVAYTLARGDSKVVEYTRDTTSDMFQIGRSSDSKIDFVLCDTIPGDKRHRIELGTQKSTISRYACRIVVDREPPYMARVYAAGFDKSNNIFLGERAPKWQHDASAMMDGLTTNGVQLMNPKGGPGCQAGIWREISVCGNVYGLRKTRSAMERGKTVTDESNVLTDGSLIDLCGAVLLWKPADALASLPTPQDMEHIREDMNATRPQCPVGLTTLVFSGRGEKSPSAPSKRPYVYEKCGHVHGYHLWNSPEGNQNSKSRTCPMCLQVSRYLPLALGTAAAFCVGEAKPTHAFIPCGHVCSEETVRFWAQVPIPHGCDAFQAICPFCAVPLEGADGFVKLIFSSDE